MTERKRAVPAEPARVLHCWADHQEFSEAAGDWVSFTCLRLDGHAGPHEWTPDSEIVIEFLPD